MNRKLVVLYERDRVLGEVELLRQDGAVWGGEVKEIRISHYSPPSVRCPPLAVMHTINSSAGICFKLESTARNRNQDSPLSHLHATCLKDNKAAVAFIGAMEIHLVAMHSRKYEGRSPCFWAFNVASKLYNSSLVMLNRRCLGIVFDLDETLIVANTLRSFEDKIEALQRKIKSETDKYRISGMLAEVKRYQDDRSLLRQYAESDQVIDNGKVVKSDPEVVLPLSDNHQTIVRPLIRLQDRNIILTRINPMIRDTSVLVRLRPAWEDLRSYLTARGRKRFEVFVCTMAEREYALEMWRLLDPESNLIDSRDVLRRVVCVKSGFKKSLSKVFQEGNCHPKMSLVIDDRLDVWDEKDHPRVHVVPAFAPYHAPQAEANNSVPVLCVARNVACNVRGCFFRVFDNGLLRQISEVAYEDDIKNVPSSPDVSNYMISEDDPPASSTNKKRNGIADYEVEKRLKANNVQDTMPTSSTAPLPVTNSGPRSAPATQHASVPSYSFAPPPPTVQAPATSFPNQQLPQATTFPKPPPGQLGQGTITLHDSPATEEGEVPESELDPDTRRRMLISQHGLGTRENVPTVPARPPVQVPARPPVQMPACPPVQVPARPHVQVPAHPHVQVPACPHVQVPAHPHVQVPSIPHVQVPAPRAQPHGWFPVEGEMSSSQLNRVVPPMQFPLDAPSGPYPPGRVVESQRFSIEALPRQEQLRLNQPMPGFHSFGGEERPDLDPEAAQIDAYIEASARALQDIAIQCGAKVEYRQALLPIADLKFLVEILFAGEKIGEGVGRTRREAHHQAAQGSLLYLADKYLSTLGIGSSIVPGNGNRVANQMDTGNGNRVANQMDNGLVGDFNAFEYQPLPREEAVPSSAAPAAPRMLDPRAESSKRPMGPVTALEEMCMTEGVGVKFHTHRDFSANPGRNSEMLAQVEINGQILGKGVGTTCDEAKSQAAEEALAALRSRRGQFPPRRPDPPRSVQQGKRKGQGQGQGQGKGKRKGNKRRHR